MAPKSKITNDGRKWCNACKTYKSFGDFHKNAQTPHGLSAYCRICISLRAGKTPRPRAPEGYKVCRACDETLPLEQFYPDRTTRRHICKKCEIQRQRERRKTPSVKASQRRHMERRRKSGAVREYMRGYSREYERKKRARRKNLPADFTPQDWRRALRYFNGCCAVCERQLEDLFQTHKASADHWIPESKGGGYTAGNIVPLCFGVDGCNNKKNNTMPKEWLFDTYGAKKGREILERVNQYFEWVKNQR